MKKSLSVPEWHQLAQEGIKIPVRIPLNGWSMEPLIRMNKDLVTVIPLDAAPKIGDIVMFADQNETRFVMHRVWRLNDHEILTWGDNCPKPDGWLHLDRIWGKAVLIERGKRKIEPDPKKGMRWARIWHHAGKVYRPCIKCKNAIRSGLDKIGALVKK